MLLSLDKTGKVRGSYVLIASRPGDDEARNKEKRHAAMIAE